MAWTIHSIFPVDSYRAIRMGVAWAKEVPSTDDANDDFQNIN